MRVVADADVTWTLSLTRPMNLHAPRSGVAMNRSVDVKHLKPPFFPAAAASIALFCAMDHSGRRSKLDTFVLLHQLELITSALNVELNTTRSFSRRHRPSGE